METLDPIALVVGPFTIYWYGLLIGAAMLIGLFWILKESKKHGIDEDTIIDMALWMLPIAIISARIYYVIFNWGYYSQNPEDIIKIWEGGLAIHGGIIGGAIVILVFCKKRGISFFRITDMVVPALMLGQIIGRWGNFFNQEAYGTEVSRSFLENLHIPEFIINQMYINGAYHHPTFLYESVWNTIGLTIILISKRKNPRLGEITCFYLIWYSFGRLFIEGLRTDSLMIFGTFRVAQIISLIGIGIGIAFLVYRRKTGLSDERYYEV